MNGQLVLVLLFAQIAWPIAAPAQGGDAVSLPPVVVTAPHPIRPPRYQKVARPAYPEVARRQGVEGTVVLSVKVLADGRTAELRVKRSSGDSLLDEAAITAARDWRFLPATQGSKPVDAWVDVPVKFELTAPK